MLDTLCERRATAQEHYQRGLDLKRKGFLLEAEQEFREAVEIDPCYFDPLLELLVEQEGKGISEEIRTDELIRRADQKYKLGMALLKNNLAEKAVRHLQAACDLERNNARYHCGLAKALAACSQAREAKANLRIAAEINGGSNSRLYRAQANYMLAKMHLKENHVRRAKRRLILAYILDYENEEIVHLMKKLGIGALRRGWILMRHKNRMGGRKKRYSLVSYTAEKMLESDSMDYFEKHG